MKCGTLSWEQNSQHFLRPGRLSKGDFLGLVWLPTFARLCYLSLFCSPMISYVKQQKSCRPGEFSIRKSIQGIQIREGTDHGQNVCLACTNLGSIPSTFSSPKTQQGAGIAPTSGWAYGWVLSLKHIFLIFSILRGLSHCILDVYTLIPIIR